MKYLVTGASGFIGKELVTSLKRAGHEVIPLVRTARNPEDLTIGNIDKNNKWGILLRDVDSVIHCAARAHITRQDNRKELDLLNRANVMFTKLIAEKCALHNIRRFVFLSTIGIYGINTNLRKGFSENDLDRPNDPYAASKLKAEKILRNIEKNSKMEVVVIRAPMVYGRGAKGTFSQLVKWVKSGLPIPFLGIDNSRSFIALDNLIDFISLCADFKRSPKAANELFVISDNETVSITELINKIALAYNVKRVALVYIPLSIIKLLARLTGQNRRLSKISDSLEVNNGKAKKLLGWKPIISMDDQLKKREKHVESN
jgi:nucleoside-diphosphate-sugar epimerase